MLGALIGWVVLGVITAGCLVGFWDDIRSWLNNTAANAVEKYLGYNARSYMTRATSVVDKLVGKIRNRSVVYTKRNRLDTFYSKVTIEAEAKPQEVDVEVLRELEKNNGSLMQEFEYRG